VQKHDTGDGPAELVSTAVVTSLDGGNRDRERFSVGRHDSVDVLNSMEPGLEIAVERRPVAIVTLLRVHETVKQKFLVSGDL